VRAPLRGDAAYMRALDTLIFADYFAAAIVDVCCLLRAFSLRHFRIVYAKMLLSIDAAFRCRHLLICCHAIDCSAAAAAPLDFVFAIILIILMPRATLHCHAR